MEDVFKPTSLSINKLFTDADALYQIPKYQRPYKWADDQVDKLWADLWDSYTSQEANYFLGSIITANANENGKYRDVVDGQQRLTTLLILFATVRDLYPEINRELSETDPYAVDVGKIKSAIQVNEKFDRLRLFTHANHQSDFDSIIVKGDTTNLAKPYKKDIRKDEEPKFKFQNTAVEFRRRLEEIGLEQAGHFINYVFNKVKIIRIDCSNVGFAIKLFQVLNTRGLDLTNADLIKSFLLSKLHDRYGAEDDILEKKERQFLQDWIYIEKLATEVEESLNDLFVMYEYFLLGTNPKRALYEELVKQFTDEDPLDVVSDFKSFCKCYQDRVYDSEDSVSYSFFYLPWGVYWRTVLISALHTKYPEYEEFRRAVRSFYYLHWMAGYTLSRVKQISFNLIKWLKERRPVNELKRELQKVSKDNNIQSRVEVALSGPIYHDAWCKPLLMLCEYNQIDNADFVDIWHRSIHVEHILPQKFERLAGWQHFVDEERDAHELVHTCGNLTLLSGKKNIDARNSPFKEKIEVYTGKGRYPSEDNKITSFRITQKLVDDYNANKFNKDWNFEALDARGNWFLEQIEELLGINLSKIKK